MESSGNNIVAATEEGIYYSTDDGTNWLLANAPVRYIPSIATGSENFVYAAVPGLGIYKSADNGINWVSSLQSPAVDYVEVAAYGRYSFAGAFFAGARYSTNFGGNWSVSSGFPVDASVYALSALNDGVVVAGTDIDPNWIYVSFNNGTSFSPYSEGLSEVASVEAFSWNDSYIFAGTYNQGVWRRLRPAVVNVDDKIKNLNSYYLSQNYPNPFNPSTKIKYKIAEDGFVSLKLYDLLGNVVATLVNIEKPAGEYEVEFSGRGLTSGIYFYQLRIGDFVQNKKMILMK
ncbi:MAG: T9SS type A sorting domain-containing protein [Ignavibacteria bacterium]|nr:T9SS type A sorting domain-containing protein [Ignavibacteria bacterium]MBT8392276.1 T9SS type A sorting domain-containing protein [Ignavibacteria bacterium]NNJ53622.1 T9SS type A sorting domain-containing protein [Ignavibacteriaceae bacterium]NNL20389.1 T9SS type A sorting domain-containing protein [Ignavibacteriaceae bacterium]